MQSPSPASREQKRIVTEYMGRTFAVVVVVDYNYMQSLSPAFDGTLMAEPCACSCMCRDGSVMCNHHHDLSVLATRLLICKQTRDGGNPSQ